MDIQKVKDLLEEALVENKTLFVTEFEIQAGNKIFVEVDGDEGVSLNECIRISRNIEHNLDREEEDFSLEVTTPDIAKPLKVQRQYIKNINRILSVKTAENNFEGTLIEVTNDAISLQWKAREPKPVGKGKVTVTKNETIPFSEIKEATVKIIFN